MTSPITSTLTRPLTYPLTAPLGTIMGQGGASLPWTPAQLESGLIGWLDTSVLATMTLDGSNRCSSMSHVNSVFADPVVQATQSKKPLYASNFNSTGYPGLTFDGTNGTTNSDIMTCATGPFTANGCWIFVVATRANANQNGDATQNYRNLVCMTTALGGAGKIFGIQVYRTNNDAAQNISSIKTMGHGADINSANLAFSKGSKALIMGQFVGGAHGLGVNGDTFNTNAVAVGPTIYDGFAIGGNGTNVADYFAGTLHEVVICDVSLLPAGGQYYERQYIEGYLAWKWGVA